MIVKAPGTEAGDERFEKSDEREGVGEPPSDGSGVVIGEGLIAWCSSGPSLDDDYAETP